MKIRSNDQADEFRRHIVIEGITRELKTFSPREHEHEDLRAIAKGLEKGRELVLTEMTGGFCNCSYKVQLQNTKAVALFVKLEFGTRPRIVSNVAACSRKRTECEFKMMELVASSSPNPDIESAVAVTPFFCFDVEDGDETTTVSVTQFSSRLEEQALGVFVDGGTIDKAFATKISCGISALHVTEVNCADPDININGDMKPYFLGLTGVTRMLFAAHLDEANSNSNKTLKSKSISKRAGANAIGKDKIMDVICNHILRTDCYTHCHCHGHGRCHCHCHCHCHTCNMPVEGNLEENSVGDNDGVILDCNWKCAHCGPIGKDIGWVYCFALACVFAHAVNGDKIPSASILGFLDTMWETYSASIHPERKADLSLQDVYRHIMGNLVMMIQCYSGIALHMEYLPINEGRREDLTRVMQSMTNLSLECYEMGFLGLPEDATLEELRNRFGVAVQDELDRLAPSYQRLVERRRSKLLRATGRRTSNIVCE